MCAVRRVRVLFAVVLIGGVGVVCFLCPKGRTRACWSVSGAGS